jgi:hypothetical protein
MRLLHAGEKFGLVTETIEEVEVISWIEQLRLVMLTTYINELANDLLEEGYRS